MGNVVVAGYCDAVDLLVVHGALQLQLFSSDHLIGQRHVDTERQTDRHLHRICNAHPWRTRPELERCWRDGHEDVETMNPPFWNMPTDLMCHVVRESGRDLVTSSWLDLKTQTQKLKGHVVKLDSWNFPIFYSSIWSQTVTNCRRSEQ